MIDFTSTKNIMEILYDSLSFKVGKPGKEKPKNHDCNSSRSTNLVNSSKLLNFRASAAAMIKLTPEIDG